MTCSLPGISAIGDTILCDAPGGTRMGFRGKLFRCDTPLIRPSFCDCGSVRFLQKEVGNVKCSDLGPKFGAPQG